MTTDELADLISDAGRLERDVSDACPADEVLSAFAQQMLNAEAAEKVEAHLADCTDCRRLVLMLKEPLPAELRRWSEAALIEQTRRKTGSRRWVPGLAIAAALLAGIFAVSFFQTQQNSVVYSVEGPFGGRSILRGADDQKVWGPSDTLELVLRPAQPSADRSLGVAVLASGDGEPLRRVSKLTIERADSGSFKISGRAADFFGERGGRKTVRLIVAPEAELEGDLEAKFPADRWLKINVEYSVEQPPSP